jgi:hypothetical protein
MGILEMILIIVKKLFLKLKKKIGLFMGMEGLIVNMLSA